VLIWCERKALLLVASRTERLKANILHRHMQKSVGMLQKNNAFFFKLQWKEKIKDKYSFKIVSRCIRTLPILKWINLNPRSAIISMNKHHDYIELAFPASPDTPDTLIVKGPDACFFLSTHMYVSLFRPRKI